MDAMRVVCFDVGGVLAEIRPVFADCARAVGLDPVPASLEGKKIGDLAFFDDYQAGRYTDDEFLQVFGDFMGVSAETAFRVHQAILVGPNPGTVELVESLRERGVKTGCLSNTNELHWRVFMEGVLLPHLPRLDFQVGSHRLKLDKPNAAIYRAFEEICGAKPGDIVFFEDGAKNVEGALACGWDAVLIDPVNDPCGQMVDALRSRGIVYPTTSP